MLPAAATRAARRVQSPRLDRRTVVSWCLYDFGNSAFAVMFSTFFGGYYSAAVVDGSRGEFLWGAAMSASMLLVAVSAPFLGGIADHSGARKRMLAAYTAAGIGTVLLFPWVEPGMVLAGFLVAVLANVAFEGGTVFYNAYLPDIAPPTHQGRVSGWGFATGYVGSLAALGAAAFFFARDRHDGAWLALAAQWALFAVPALLFLPEDRRTGVGVLDAARTGFRRTFDVVREVLGMRELRRFLLAYFVYEDGVNTVIVMAGVYARKTLDFSQGELVAMLGIVQLAALLGSLAMAGPTDRLGPKRVVRATLLWWTGVVVFAFFATTKASFLAAAGLAGLGLGGVQAASRAFMARLVPQGREAEMFGFYALCGRTGAVLGPVLYGAIATLVGGQRPAILFVACFYLVGWVLVGRVNLPARCSSNGPR